MTDMLFNVLLSFVALLGILLVEKRETSEVKNETHEHDAAPEESFERERAKILARKAEELEVLVRRKEEQIILMKDQYHLQLDDLRNQLTRERSDSRLRDDRIRLLQKRLAENTKAPKPSGGNWNSFAKNILVVSWDESFGDDVDVHVADPAGGVVYFRNQIGRGFFIDRDDLGERDLPREENREIVQFFRLQDTSVNPYRVNLHLFSAKSDRPVPVRVEIYSLSQHQSELMKTFEVRLTKEDSVRGVCELWTGDGRIVRVEPSHTRIPNLFQTRERKDP